MKKSPKKKSRSPTRQKRTRKSSSRKSHPRKSSPRKSSSRKSSSRKSRSSPRKSRSRVRPRSRTLPSRLRSKAARRQSPRKSRMSRYRVNNVFERSNVFKKYTISEMEPNYDKTLDLMNVMMKNPRPTSYGPVYKKHINLNNIIGYNFPRFQKPIKENLLRLKVNGFNIRDGNYRNRGLEYYVVAIRQSPDVIQDVTSIDMVVKILEGYNKQDRELMIANHLSRGQRDIIAKEEFTRRGAYQTRVSGRHPSYVRSLQN